jgi:hypothetical protein
MVWTHATPHPHTSFIPPNASATTSTLNPHNSGASEDEEDKDEIQHPQKRQHADSTLDSEKPEVHKEQGARGLKGRKITDEGEWDNHDGQGDSGGQEQFYVQKHPLL